MFGKKKDTKQDQSIPKNDDSKKGFKKEVESRKGLRMAEGKLTNLTQDADIKGTIKFSEAMRIDGKFDGELITDNGELTVGKTGDVNRREKQRDSFPYPSRRSSIPQWSICTCPESPRESAR